MAEPAGPSRRHRLEMRVSAEKDALIREAADLEHTTVTGFVLDTATARAKWVVEQHRDLTLSNEAFDALLAALDEPAEPVAELVQLFDEHTKLPEA